tara:strand:- start:373 stop:627 length:255 start_codon:yes stop_codon:yes gene_type:complete
LCGKWTNGLLARLLQRPKQLVPMVTLNTKEKRGKVPFVIAVVRGLSYAAVYCGASHAQLLSCMDFRVLHRYARVLLATLLQLFS